jgi:hypothetical protein
MESLFGGKNQGEAEGEQIRGACNLRLGIQGEKQTRDEF